MKKLLIFFALVISVLASHAQSKGYLPYDSTYVQKKGGNAEMIIENGSRNIKGFLYNLGNGRTVFKQAAIKLDDTTYVIGADTLIIKTGTNTTLQGIDSVLALGDTAFNRNLIMKDASGTPVIWFSPDLQYYGIGDVSGSNPGFPVIDMSFADSVMTIATQGPLRLTAGKGIVLQTAFSTFGTYTWTMQEPGPSGVDQRVYMPYHALRTSDTIATLDDIRIGAIVGPNVFNSNGTLTGDRHVSGHGTRGLFLDSLTQFAITSTGLGGSPAFQVGDGASNFSTVLLGDVAGVGNKTRFVVDDANLAMQAIGVNGLTLILNTFATSNRVILKTQNGFGGNNNIYLPAYNSGTDTLLTAALARTLYGGGGALDTATALTGLTTLYQNGLKVSTFVPFGTLYNSNSWPTLTGDWTNTGATVSIVANKINMSGGSQAITSTVGTTNTRPVQYLTLTSYGKTMLERYKYVAKIKINGTPGASTYGVGIGTYSTNSLNLQSDLIAYFNTSTGTGGGKIFILGAGNGTVLAASSTTVPLNQNDYYLITLERNLDVITASIRDLTVDTAIAYCSYTYETSVTSNVMPNTGYFCVANYGSPYIIDSTNITSNEPKYANLLMLGDSKFTGYSTPFNSRAVSILNNRLGGGVVGRGGQSDKTSDMVAALPEALAMLPKKVVLELGRNDLIGGSPIPQYVYGPNIDTIYARLTRAGCDVYLLDAIYETVQNQDSLKRYINSKYGVSGTIATNRVIHTYQLGSVAGSLSSDNIHPSMLGHSIVANAIIDFLNTKNNAKYINDIEQKQFSYQVIDSLIITGTLKVGTGKSTFYMPANTTPGDIIMQRDNAITANNVSLAGSYNRIVPLNSTNAGMDFRTYGGTGTPFTWYGSSGGAGSQVQWLQIVGTGVIKTGAAITGNTAAIGDIYIPANSKLASANAGNAGFETYILLHNGTDNAMEFHNPETGNFRFYSAPTTVNTELLQATLFKTGHWAFNKSTDNFSWIQINGAIWQNKDSVATSATPSTYILGIDSVSGKYVKSLMSLPITGQTTLVSGTKAITIPNLTASSKCISIVVVTPSGTTLTTAYQGVCTTNTLTLQANLAAGTINTADGTIVNYQVQP